MSFAFSRDESSLVLEPGLFAGLKLDNRVAVSPMTRVSATADGIPTPRIVSYYRSFAEGGFGVIITEGTYTDEIFSRGYANRPGLVTEAQLEGWRQVTEAVHAAGKPIFAQLMHAGALSQVLEETAGPSALQPKGEKMPEYGGEGPFPTPESMSEADLGDAIAGFAAAGANAKAAGFDGVEVHGANGYLIDQFLTDYANDRRDQYGGSVAARARFAADVVRAVKEAVGDGFPVGIRLSQGKVNDHGYRWPGGRADAEAIFAAVAGAGADYIHVASEGRDWRESARIDDGLTITQVAKQTTGLPVITNGGMHAPELAETVLREGHGDVVALARGALANPDWPNRLREGRSFEAINPAMITPSASIENTDSWLHHRRVESAGGTRR